MATTSRSETVTVHGRDFQRWSIDQKIYLVPVDDEEEERLALQHRLLYWVLGQRLYEPDIGNPARILDCGSGSGLWAGQIADQFPDSQVDAYDIYPSEHTEDLAGNDNLTTHTIDLNQRLRVGSDKDRYDFIHSRCVAGGINAARWDHYIRDLRRMLRPGGIIQFAEYKLSFQSSSGSLQGLHPSVSYAGRWWQMYKATMETTFRKDVSIGSKLEQKLRAQSFRNVAARTYRIPFGSWEGDRLGDTEEGNAQRAIGTVNLDMVSRLLLDSHAIYPFTHCDQSSYTPQQVKWLNDGVRGELLDPGLQVYINLYVVWGQV